MSTDSTISNVSGNYRAQYKPLKFKDTNKNRIIEKNSSEKYKDTDSKKRTIDHILSKIKSSGMDKNEKAILFNKALNIARTIVDPFDKAMAIKDIACGMIEAEMEHHEIVSVLKEALGIVRTFDEFVDDSADKAFEIMWIASKLDIVGSSKNEVNGLLKEALGITRTIKEISVKADHLGRVASAMADAKLNKDEISKIFIEALDTAKIIEEIIEVGYPEKEDCIRNIASRIAKSGLDKNELRKLFIKALEVAQTIKKSSGREWTIAIIASFTAEAGLIKEALGIANGLKDQDFKEDALTDIAAEMGKAKSDKHETIKVFKEALEIGKNCKDLELRSTGFGYIAERMAEAGLNKNEIITVFKELGLEPPK